MGIEEGWKTFIPAFEYCTDNAAMIAITGYYKYLAGIFEDLSVVPSARAVFRHVPSKQKTQSLRINF